MPFLKSSKNLKNIVWLSRVSFGLGSYWRILKFKIEFISDGVPLKSTRMERWLKENSGFAIRIAAKKKNVKNQKLKVIYLENDNKILLGWRNSEFYVWGEIWCKSDLEVNLMKTSNFSTNFTIFVLFCFQKIQYSQNHRRILNVSIFTLKFYSWLENIWSTFNLSLFFSWGWK